MERVSVIIPTYNRGEKILNSVNSVLQQTYDDIELLVVDDGSVDSTQEIIESIRDERIRYIRQTKNIGASAARNEGAKQAKSEIIAYNDSDDLWKPEKLEKQMKYWERHSEFSMVYCAYSMNRPEGTFVVPDEQMEGELEGDIFLWLLLRNSIGTPTMVMRRADFFKAGGFDTTFRSLEDWEFAIRFSEKNGIGYISDILVDAGYNEDGISSRVSAYYESRCKIIAKYKHQLMENGIFENVVNDVLMRAQKRGILETVKKMLILFLRTM